MSRAKFKVNAHLIIEFKSYPYHWKLTQEGKKPFDLRLIDTGDARFKYLGRWRGNPDSILIKLINTETGEYLYYKLDDLRWDQPSIGWLTILLGKEIKEE